MSSRLKKIADATVAGLRAVFVRNFHLKAIALLLTFALYLWVGQDREIQMIESAPLQVSVPEDQILLKPKIDQVRLTLRGRWSALNRFDQTDLKPVHVELSKNDDGEIVQFTSRHIRLPPGVRVESFEPQTVQVELADRVEKSVPIRPRVYGRPGASHVVADVEPTPREVTISGPGSVLDDLQEIPTERIDVTGRVSSFAKKPVQLHPESPHVNYELDEPLKVSVTIEADEVERTVEDIPVRPVNTTYETHLENNSLDLTVEGTKSQLEKLDPTTIHAVLDLSAEDDRAPGTFDKKVEIRNLPDNVKIVRANPEHFVVETRPRESSDQDGPDDLPSEDGDN